MKELKKLAEFLSGKFSDKQAEILTDLLNKLNSQILVRENLIKKLKAKLNGAEPDDYEDYYEKMILYIKATGSEPVLVAKLATDCLQWILKIKYTGDMKSINAINQMYSMYFFQFGKEPKGIDELREYYSMLRAEIRVINFKHNDND